MMRAWGWLLYPRMERVLSGLNSFPRDMEGLCNTRIGLVQRITSGTGDSLPAGHTALSSPLFKSNYGLASEARR
jgi:hypothetical protein